MLLPSGPISRREIPVRHQVGRVDAVFECFQLGPYVPPQPLTPVQPRLEPEPIPPGETRHQNNPHRWIRKADARTTFAREQFCRCDTTRRPLPGDGPGLSVAP